jgi:chorismate synthase
VVKRPGYSDGTFASKYELKEIVGVGSTSSCHRCVRKSDSSHFACKVIDKRQIEVNFSGLLEQFHVEVKVSGKRLDV